MRERFRRLYLVGVTTVALAVATTAPTPAQAYRTDRERTLDLTAYTLNQGEARVGLLKWGVGLFDQLELATYTLPWVVGAVVETVAPNFELKAVLYDRRRLALSATASFATGGVKDEDSDTTIRYFVAPLGITSSVRINQRFWLHTGARYTITSSDGEIAADGQDSTGALILDLLQVWVKFEFRFSRVITLNLTLRQVAYAGDSVIQGTTGLDDTTTTDFRLNVDAEDVRAAFAGIIGVDLSWRLVNLQFGVGYRNLFLDSLGLVVPLNGRYPYPLFDVFVRF